MIGPPRHLRDQGLLDHYGAARTNEWTDPRTAEHLVECAACAARYGELVEFLDGVRADADAETAAIFTPDRLRAQQQQIAQRISHLGHSAHVISFPAPVGRPSPTASRIAPRWVAAAAAAGLFVGIGTGIFLKETSRPGARSRSDGVMALSIAPTAPVAVPQDSPSSLIANPPSADADSGLALDDVEAFMADLETALDGPHTRELLPFDALTPSVLEVSAQLR